MKKHLWLHIFLLFFLILIAACRKEQQPVEKEKREKDRSPKPESAGDGKLDLLGYGYDVTGEYANSSAAKFSVINIEALQRDQPTRIEIDLSKKQNGYLVTGENAWSYLEKRSLKIKGGFGFKLFGKEITSNFYNNTFDSLGVDQKHVYSSFDLVIQQKRLKQNASINLLKRYLQASFQYDIEEESPEFIVNGYGTHVLTDITLGAKLQILYQSETRNSNRTQAAEAGIDVNVGKVFNLSVGTGHTEQEISNNFSQVLRYKTYGGSPAVSLIGQVPIGSTVPRVDIQPWQNSSSVANAEMIDFNPETLIPIYEFIADSVKREAVKSYVSQYIKDREIKLVDNTVVVQERRIIMNTNPPNPRIASYYIYFYNKYGKPMKIKSLTVNYRFIKVTSSAGIGTISTEYEPAKSVTATNADFISIGMHTRSYTYFKPLWPNPIEESYGVEILPGDYQVSNVVVGD